MSSSEIISAVALVISVTSLGLSAYVVLRDRGRLRTKSNFYAAHEDRPASMRVEAVNVGRRPVIFTLFGGYYEGGHWSGTYIGDHKTGFRLGENEKFSEDIDDLHHMLFDHETGAAVTDYGLRTLLDANTLSRAQRSTSNSFSNEMQPNQAMEPTASRRTIQLSMSSTRESAATPCPRSRQLILFSLGGEVKRWLF